MAIEREGGDNLHWRSAFNLLPLTTHAAGGTGKRMADGENNGAISDEKKEGEKKRKRRVEIERKGEKRRASRNRR